MIHAYEHVHREEMQNVQQLGYTDACNGAGSENPYESCRPEHNQWVYGYMLGLSAKRRAEHARR